jgi:MFS transporter, FSR family, fosmidomycin resistance protein
MSSTSDPLSLPADVGAKAGARAGILRDAKVISLISVVHFVNHLQALMLPPIFLLVKASFGVGYTEIAFAITAYNIVSALLQTPAGFLVDRIGPRIMLTGGLLVAAIATAVIALVPGYWTFIAAYALLGVSNTVYHPADYSILSSAIDGKRIGKAFSVHTFSGYMGFGAAPAFMIACSALWGWHGAYLAAAVLALGAAILLMSAGHILPKAPRRPAVAVQKPVATDNKVGWDLLLSAPILRNLFFFLCLGMANGGIQTYSVVSQQVMFGTPASISNIALSGFLLMSAAGVLLGGVIADRTEHHGRVAAIGFACTAVMAILMGWVALPGFALILVMSVGGVLNGMIQPSRDMMVRSVTPPGSFGKVFGFVTTGLNIGGMIAPLAYGWMMDHGQPQMIYAVVTLFILLALVTAITRRKPEGSLHGLARAR